MFPGVGKFTSCETGVDKIEKDVTDGIETEPENLDADTVRTGGRGVLHRPRFHGHLKSSLMPLSGVLKITPRFHGYLKASLNVDYGCFDGQRKLDHTTERL